MHTYNITNKTCIIHDACIKTHIYTHLYSCVYVYITNKKKTVHKRKKVGDVKCDKELIMSKVDIQFLCVACL